MCRFKTFSQMPVEAFMDGRLTKTDLRVLGAIFSFADAKTLKCHPKRESIAERCALPVKEVSVATSSLVRHGWLEKSGNGGLSRASQYQILVPVLPEKTLPDSGTKSIKKKSKTLPNSGTDTVHDSCTKVIKNEDETVHDSCTKTGYDSCTNTLHDSCTRLLSNELTKELTKELTSVFEPVGSVPPLPNFEKNETEKNADPDIVSAVNELPAVDNLPVGELSVDNLHGVDDLSVDDFVQSRESVDEVSLFDENLPVSENEVLPAKKAKPKNDKSAQVVEIFEFWKKTMNHERAILDAKRKKKIESALALGYGVEDLLLAVLGCSKSTFHMGENDKGTRYDSIDLIFRNADKIEEFIGKVTNQNSGSGYKNKFQQIEYGEFPSELFGQPTGYQPSPVAGIVNPDGLREWELKSGSIDGSVVDVSKYTPKTRQNIEISQEWLKESQNDECVATQERAEKPAKEIPEAQLVGKIAPAVDNTVPHKKPVVDPTPSASTWAGNIVLADGTVFKRKAKANA